MTTDTMVNSAANKKSDAMSLEEYVPPQSPLRQFTLRVLIGVTLVVVLVAAGMWLSPYSPSEADFFSRLLPPGSSHWFGTDQLGRDIGTRLLYGAMWSLGLSFLISAFGLVVGTLVGLLAAQVGKVADLAIMRVTDSFFAFPELVAAVTIAGLFGPSTVNLVIALMVTSWMKFARLARSLSLSLGEQDFVIQARLNGLSSLGILWRHVLPNVIPSLLVLWTSSWSRTILAVSGLSFLGFGVQPPTAEWGAMLLDGKSQLQTAPHVMIFPGLAVLVAVLAINLTGDRLRDLLARN